MKIRKGNSRDIAAVHNLVCVLAEHVGHPFDVDLSIEELKMDYESNKLFDFLVAEDDSQAIVGMSLFYFTYSTWKGKTLYIEDVVVIKKYRNQGYGKALLDQTIKEGISAGCKRIHWQVLETNKSALEFYQSKFEITPNNSWIICMLEGEKLDNFR